MARMHNRHRRAHRALPRPPLKDAGLAFTAIALVAAGLIALGFRSGSQPQRQVLPIAPATGPSRAPSPTSPPATAPPPTAPPRLGLPTTAVGDSIMIDIQPYLAALVPGISIDGMVSRQWDTGVTILSGLRSSGRLTPEVVVGLGTNGPVTPAQFDAMMQAVAGAKRVVVVNTRVPRSWQDETNATLTAGVARYPGTVLADWYTLSANQPAWFTADGIHLEPAGAQALASLIASKL